MSFQKIIPTRTNYLKYQKRLLFATRGKRLLEIKREQFYVEIRTLRQRAIEAKKKIRVQLQKGYYNLNFAYSFSGKVTIKYLSEFLQKFMGIQFKITWARKFGVEVPKFRDLSFPPIKYAPYGFIETSIYLDRAIKFFRQAFNLIISLAEIEGELFRLSFEFQKLQRRIRSLEDFTIPRIQTEINRIELILEDLEREESIRMKKIKQHIEEKEISQAT